MPNQPGGRMCSCRLNLLIYLSLASAFLPETLAGADCERSSSDGLFEGGNLFWWQRQVVGTPSPAPPLP